MSENTINDNTCVVCFKNVEYYSIGECEHPVCYECSTRMRVLCAQSECPICRQVVARVIFTDTIEPFKKLSSTIFPDHLFERQYKIGFCSEKIKDAYLKLLEHKCNLCPDLPPFRSFNVLSDHMRKHHELFYCELCVKHLKIFTSERKCYTRSKLALHRRKGDSDDTSHRGHPLCMFCEERYMDNDELYRHLRKEHLYCHLCDADGRNHYYAGHTALIEHFRNEHYLCEEGECAQNQLTAVFRTDIDLKAHKATSHGKGLAKSAARQARVLELQFNINPGATSRASVRVDRMPAEVTPTPDPTPPLRQQDRPSIDSDQHFPSLTTNAGHPSLVTFPGPSVSSRYKSPNKLTRNDENFPALDSSSTIRVNINSNNKPTASALLQNGKSNVAIKLQSKPASNFRITQASGNRISSVEPNITTACSSSNSNANKVVSKKKQIVDSYDDDFPTLTSVPVDNYPSLGASTLQPSKVSVVSNRDMSNSNQLVKKQFNKPEITEEAFPALSSSSTPVSTPKWVTNKKPQKKVEEKRKNVAEAPKIPNINEPSDFPQLKNKSKNKKKTQNDDNRNFDESKENSFQQSWNKDNNIFKNDVSVKNEKKKGKSQSIAGSNQVYTNKINLINGDIIPPDNNNSDIGKLQNHVVNENSNNVTNNSFATDTNKKKKNVPLVTTSNVTGEYSPPRNFEERNVLLMKHFYDALGSVKEMEAFRDMSRAFRDGVIHGKEFLQHCYSSLGTESAKKLLPELVALLPDVKKQHELIDNDTYGLIACPVCAQLLVKDDKISHEASHWPSLPTPR